MGVREKHKEFHGWVLSAEQHVRQALEVYSGDSVRLSYLNIDVISLDSNTCSLEVEGVVIGSKLADGTTHKFSVWVNLKKVDRRNGWQMNHPDYNHLQIGLYGEGVDAPYQDGYHYAVFEPGDGECVLPLVKVFRTDEECVPLPRETCRIGHHLGDRQIVAMSEARPGL